MKDPEYRKLRALPVTAYAQAFARRQGQYATIGHRILMKCIALHLESKGELIRWHDKPGWRDGMLVDSEKYNEWFKAINF